MRDPKVRTFLFLFYSKHFFNNLCLKQLQEQESMQNFFLRTHFGKSKSFFVKFIIFLLKIIFCNKKWKVTQILTNHLLINFFDWKLHISKLNNKIINMFRGIEFYGGTCTIIKMNFVKGPFLLRRILWRGLFYYMKLWGGPILLNRFLWRGPK